jgi:hypothetical protein
MRIPPKPVRGWSNEELERVAQVLFGLEIALDPHHRMLALEIHSELWRRMQGRCGIATVRP